MRLGFATQLRFSDPFQVQARSRKNRLSAKLRNSGARSRLARFSTSWTALALLAGCASAAARGGSALSAPEQVNCILSFKDGGAYCVLDPEFRSWASGELDNYICRKYDDERRLMEYVKRLKDGR